MMYTKFDYVTTHLIFLQDLAEHIYHFGHSVTQPALYMTIYFSLEAVYALFAALSHRSIPVAGAATSQ
jgi:hypothetical protein